MHLSFNMTEEEKEWGGNITHCSDTAWTVCV